MFAQSLKSAGLAENKKARTILNRLTLEEKLHIVIGINGFPLNNLQADKNPGPAKKGSTINKSGNAKALGAAGSSTPVARLNIRSMVFADGSSGLRINPIRNNDSSHTFYTTQFPSGTLLASSWDTSLVSKVGAALGNEAKSYGVDILLAPSINIQRNPLGGRNYEYYSEDPLLTGKLATSMIRGIQSNGIGASIKHFAANNQETNRHSINEIISERALREIYLKGFEIAIKESAPWTVMSSYNKINGVYASESNDLLTQLLRKEWKYKGFVVTDWYGGKDAVAQQNAGNDLLMPGKQGQYEELLAAVHSGKLTMQQLDLNVMNILKVYLKTKTYLKYVPGNSPDLQKHTALARLAASEGMVLLKNENHSLPLKSSQHIALFGISAYTATADNTTKAFYNKKYSLNLLRGLISAGYMCDITLADQYTKYLRDEELSSKLLGASVNKTHVANELLIEKSAIEAAAEKTDLAVISIGRTSNKGTDRKIENDFNLSADELAMIKNISEVFHQRHKKVLVILNICGVIETVSWRDLTDAILLSWQPGLEGGGAIADVLTGKINPSGKLTVSFPVNYQDVPSAANFPGTPASYPAEVIYQEGIYVGYRYYTTFKVPVAYPFGFGLSYTSFTYSGLQVTRSGNMGKFIVNLSVKNTGAFTGKEVAEVYISAPGKSTDKPERELKAFVKTRLLKPGQSQKCTFMILPGDLASFDTAKASWIADAGSYTARIGNAADTKLSKEFKLDNTITVEKTTNALAPVQKVNELKPSEK